MLGGAAIIQRLAAAFVAPKAQNAVRIGPLVAGRFLINKSGPARWLRQAMAGWQLDNLV